MQAGASLTWGQLVTYGRQVGFVANEESDCCPKGEAQGMHGQPQTLMREHKINIRWRVLSF